MELAQRRIVARIVRLGLFALTIVLVAGWWVTRRAAPHRRVQVQMDMSALPVAGPGDFQLFNEDSTVDLILVGDRITAGLSPQLVAKIRGEMTRSAAKETTGFGGSIARMVTQTVADKIGTRAVFSVRDIEDIRFDRGRVIVVWKSGGEDEILGNVKVDGERASGRFREDEARRFVDAVRARIREMR